MTKENHLYITINGQLGSGKSSVCKLLQEHCGYEIFSTGKIQRQFAQELGISTLELNELSKNDFSYDEVIDSRLVQHAKAHEGEKIIFDSRMAFFFVENAFRVHLLVSPSVAANRVFFGRSAKEEDYKDLNQALFDLVGRRVLEQRRYADLYKIDVTDFANYHLVLDTSTLSAQQVFDICVSEQSKFLSAQGGRETYPQVYISPKNVYPTSANTDQNKVEEWCEKIKNCPLPPVELTKEGDCLFISQCHELVEALIKCDVAVAKAVVNKGKGAEALFASDSEAKDIVGKWEKRNGFTFGYYPF